MKSDARQQSHSVELRSLLKHLASRARIAFGDKKAQLAFRYLVNGALMVGIIVVSPSLSHAEIRFEAAQFYFTWARLAEFFDFASTGNTILTIPPARSDQAEPVVVRSFALCSEEDCPTTCLLYTS
ncbi:MAG: hypothetical protein N2Z21_11000, partial [Candidatus Sumerlaeaceae bacterium]|nr:hypothetical protein [Candidatus Sumerlaeaceae bacterium]